MSVYGLLDCRRLGETFTFSIVLDLEAGTASLVGFRLPLWEGDDMSLK